MGKDIFKDLEDGECVEIKELDEKGMKLVACKVEDEIKYEVHDENGNEKFPFPMNLSK